LKPEREETGMDRMDGMKTGKADAELWAGHRHWVGLGFLTAKERE
jgi:hypothetical protein